MPAIVVNSSRILKNMGWAMKLDTNGLPQPGRELDAAIGRLLGYEVVDRHYKATSMILQEGVTLISI